jgi:hypothetical protein
MKRSHFVNVKNRRPCEILYFNIKYSNFHFLYAWVTTEAFFWNYRVFFNVGYCEVLRVLLKARVLNFQ